MNFDVLTATWSEAILLKISIVTHRDTTLQSIGLHILRIRKNYETLGSLDLWLYIKNATKSLLMTTKGLFPVYPSI